MNITKIIALVGLFGFFLACEPNEPVVQQKNPPMLLSKAITNGVNTIDFEYDEQNRLTKYTYDSGSTMEFTYDDNDKLTEFKEVSTANAIIPIRRFTVETNTSAEIYGTFRTYDPNDVELPQYRSHIRYTLENGLLKTYAKLDTMGNTTFFKEFVHNADGNLTDYFFNHDAGPNHIYKYESSSFDGMTETNPFVSIFNGYLPIYMIPGYKLTNQNAKNYASFAPNASWGGFDLYYDYNGYDQVTRIYKLYETYDEEGNLIDSGEATISSYEYVPSL